MIFGDCVVYWFSTQTSVSGVLLIYLVRFLFQFNTLQYTNECMILDSRYNIGFGTNLRNSDYDFPFVSFIEHFFFRLFESKKKTWYSG